MIIIHAHAFLNSTCSLGTASHRGKVPLLKLQDFQHRQDKPFGVVVMHQQQQDLPSGNEWRPDSRAISEVTAHTQLIRLRTHATKSKPSQYCVHNMHLPLALFRH